MYAAGLFCLLVYVVVYASAYAADFFVGLNLCFRPARKPQAFFFVLVSFCCLDQRGRRRCFWFV